MPDKERLSLSRIMEIEPAVADVLHAARRSRKTGWHGYDGYRRQLFTLVGFQAAKRELRSPEAYETTVKGLCRAMCRRRTNSRRRSG